MNKILLALFALMFVLSACEDSTSASDSGSKGGSFPSNGDPNFYCEVTKGDNWWQMKLMCQEWEQELKEKSRKKNFKDAYCGNGVFYSVIEYEGQSRESIEEEASYFEEDCQRYKKKWENGEFDEEYDD